jgi:hypothetical protein
MHRQVQERYDERLWTLHTQASQTLTDAYNPDLHYPLLLTLTAKSTAAAAAAAAASDL